MINGYINYLQNALGNKYYVTQEEKTDYPDKNLCLLSQFQGVNYRNAILFTYQMTVFTNNVEETMNELMTFSWEQNELVLSTNDFSYIKQLMSQPINKTNFGQMHTEYLGTIDITITLVCSTTVSDIKEIKIDNEIIEPTQATITYQSVIDNQRNNNEEINSTIINESSLNMQVTFPINNSNTYLKARNVMFGILPKNTKFNVSLEFADGFRTKIEMVMPSNALSLERSTLTTCTINLSK